MVPVEHLEHLLAPGDIIFNAVLEATSSNLVYALSLEKDSPLPGKFSFEKDNQGRLCM